MIKIAELKDGCSVQYNANNEYFYVIDKDNKEIVNGETQTKVMSKYTKYLKSLTNKHCPMEVIDVSMLPCVITSFDDETNQVWATVTKGNRFTSAGERGKHTLYNYNKQPKFFKMTDANRVTIAAYNDLQNKIAELEKQSKVLISSLECPVTEKDFIE
jgi:hypothetical protein